MAAEELADLERLDAKLKAMKSELKAGVQACGSPLMDINGSGAAGAAWIIQASTRCTSPFTTPIAGCLWLAWPRGPPALARHEGRGAPGTYGPFVSGRCALPGQGGRLSHGQQAGGDES